MKFNDPCMFFLFTAIIESVKTSLLAMLQDVSMETEMIDVSHYSRMHATATRGRAVNPVLS
jgi:hypothetical protein